MSRAALFLALALAGCNTLPAAVTTCLPLVTYTPAEQAELAAELTPALGVADPQVLQVVKDYLAMRDADRACLGKHP